MDCWPWPGGPWPWPGPGPGPVALLGTPNLEKVFRAFGTGVPIFFGPNLEKVVRALAPEFPILLVPIWKKCFEPWHRSSHFVGPKWEKSRSSLGTGVPFFFCPKLEKVVRVLAPEFPNFRQKSENGFPFKLHPYFLAMYSIKKPKFGKLIRPNPFPSNLD